MSATTAGGFRAYLTPLLGGVPVFRDGPAEGQPLPYVVVQEGTNYAPHPGANGDYGDPNRELTIDELVQIEVVQQARTQAGGIAPNVEDYDLGDTVMWLCDQPVVPAPGTSRITAVKFMTAHREPIADNAVRHVITVQVTRTLQKGS
ncbi:hypothetical protein [Kitasatospora purpeofusca]|uniref:hypothetical protein n=1 Tax=Kitasatospora purpeofusca TaxID=67352 RepID=UPI00364EF252